MRESRKNYKSIKKLAMISSFTAIILTLSTYAWFIGMRTVSVNTFDVEIKAADSLMLSLDGDVWVDTLDVSKAILDALKVETAGVTPYAGSTHTWGGDAGLIPMSSIGELEEASSRMKLFEKSSLTATPGGYRLMASRVKNFQDVGDTEIPAEPNGYIAFDLFVKNFSGTQYLKKLNVLDEEAIYLTVDSAVKVAIAGGGVAGTGIENSVRVAFAQIGRVDASEGKAGLAKIQGITCIGDGAQDGTFVETGHADDYTTGICRTAQIWEPNDTRHEANAISWYNTSCVARKTDGTGTDVTDEASFGGVCGTVTDGIAKPTYAVKSPITSGDNVDTYDGSAYNGYTASATVLGDYKYFTDTTKHLSGNARSAFMTLAPNSITKIRVYVFIEGQDIDNYDFAAIGKRISVNFGFTKERYTEDDIVYDGPDVNQGVGPNGEDLTPPRITMAGQKEMTLVKGTAFSDPGAAAVDNLKDVNGDPVVVPIVTLGVVNNQVPGVYTLTYTSTDVAGNMASKVRTVTVTD